MATVAQMAFGEIPIMCEVLGRGSAKRYGRGRRPYRADPAKASAAIAAEQLADAVPQTSREEKPRG